MPQSYAGTVVCCADGDAARVATVLNEQCESALCGATCSDIEGCGWSTTRGRCIAGATTSKAEMEKGSCTEAELRRGCERHICGADCADDTTMSCTWSKPRGRCVEGTRPTPQNQRHLGVCRAPTEFANEAEAKKLCKKIPCASNCDGICGWSSKRKMCLFGKKTNDQELGECNVDYVGPTPDPKLEDPCNNYRCGEECAAHSECGWVSDSQKCIQGARTSPAERVQGLCNIEETNNHFCKQFDCAPQCKAYPGCGWSKRRMLCMAGHVTNDNELGMCRATDGDEHPPTVTAPTTEVPTTAAPVTAAPVTAAPNEVPVPTAVPTTLAPVTPAPVTAAPVSNTFAGCMDFPPQWVDSEGEGCVVYAGRGYCAARAAGPSWNNQETFADYAANGFDAGTSCCVCGGGVSETSAKTCSQLDYPLTKSPNATGVCGNSYGSDGTCLTNDHMEATWEEAQAACTKAGARLCTDHELWSNVPQGSGCRIDKYLVWSSTECPDGSHFAGWGRNPFGGDPSLVAGCRASSLGAAIRCCADV